MHSVAIKQILSVAAHVARADTKGFATSTRSDASTPEFYNLFSQHAPLIDRDWLRSWSASMPRRVIVLDERVRTVVRNA